MQTETMTVKEAAQRLGVGINQAYEGCERGQIPNIRFGRRWLIPRVAFESWLRDCSATNLRAPSDQEAYRTTATGAPN